MRYKGIKGRFWAIFSEFIRKRDFKKYGVCIVCGKKFESWQESQAGHFAPAGNCGFALLFSEDNVHAECAYDNAFNAGHLIQYKTNLIKRYGEAFTAQLEAKYNDSRYKGKTTKEWSKKEYQTKIDHYKNLIHNLDTFD